jgi:hypothetical protein
MLASVIEIDNLGGLGEMWMGDVSNPFGPIAHEDLLFRPAPTALPGFQMDVLQIYNSFAL